MHDVFVVTSEGSGGGHITRIVYAADEETTRSQTHQDDYPGESIVAMTTRIPQLTSIAKSIESSASAAPRFR